MSASLRSAPEAINTGVVIAHGLLVHMERQDSGIAWRALSDGALVAQGTARNLRDGVERGEAAFGLASLHQRVQVALRLRQRPDVQAALPAADEWDREAAIDMALHDLRRALAMQPRQFDLFAAMH